MGDVLVVVPARDEASRIGSCVRSVRRSLAHATWTGVVDRSAVVVVGHRCLDDTLGRAELGLAPAGPVPAGGPGGRYAVLAEAAATTVGEVRTLGVQAGIDLLAYGTRAVRRGQVWVLSTDADTVVPPTWVADVLGRAHEAGSAHAVVGMARLAGERLSSAGVQAAYRRIIAAGVHGRVHDHVYGANLAVRADAYEEVGGFQPVVVGEDRVLVEALAEQGFLVARPRDLVVTTSDRRDGRARGGLADLLAGLDRRAAGDLWPEGAELSAPPRVA